MFAGRATLRDAQGVVITGGRETSGTRTGWSVSKGELVSKLQALLHAGDLRIAASLPDAAVLARELQVSQYGSPITRMPRSMPGEGRTMILCWPWRLRCLS